MPSAGARERDLLNHVFLSSAASPALMNRLGVFARRDESTGTGRIEGTAQAQRQANHEHQRSDGSSNDPNSAAA